MSTESAYMTALLEHIDYVQQAGRKIGVKNEQLLIHDESKFSVYEFGPYARYFYNPDGTKRTNRTAEHIEDFTKAWLHHFHYNPHHWQSWLIPNGFSHGEKLDDDALEMPIKYVLEMVADWMGASMAYTRDWDMTEWLKTNMPRITVHPSTAIYLREVLASIGYSNIVYSNKFGHEMLSNG